MTETALASRELPYKRRWIMLSSGAALLCATFGAVWSNPGGAVTATVFLASLGGRIGGVAFSALCGVVLFRLDLDPLRAVQIMLACSIANQAVMTWWIRRTIDWRNLGVFLVGGVLGLPLGLWLLLPANHRLYTRELGAFLVAYGGYRLTRPPVILRVQHLCLDLVAGALAGITGTAAAFPSAPVAIWCSFKGWDKTQQRAVFQPFILIMQIASLLTIYLVSHTGTLQGDTFALADLLCVPAGLLGTFTGLALYRRISTHQFVTSLNLLLIVAGVSFLI